MTLNSIEKQSLDVKFVLDTFTSQLVTCMLIIFGIEFNNLWYLILFYRMPSALRPQTKTAPRPVSITPSLEDLRGL